MKATADRRVRPSICPDCRAKVIWARIRPEKAKFGGRQMIPFSVDECDAGTGDIALSKGLFELDGQAPLAERVSNGTNYRSHRDYCPAVLAKTKPPAAAGGRRARKSFTSTAPQKKTRGAR